MSAAEPDELQLLARRRWPLGRHPGGLGWELTGQLPSVVDVWRRPDGSVSGWAGIDGPGELTVEADDDVAAEALRRAVESAAGDVLELHVPDGDDALRAAAAGSGFQRAEAWTGMWRAASVDDRPGVVAGCVVRAVGDHERHARIDVHRRAWRPADLPWHPDRRPATPEDAESSFDESALARTEATWLYDRDLDLVVESPQGELVGCCTVWLDPALGVAEIEPLGVVPAYRRLGLAGALCREASARVAERGGHEVFINAGPRLAYPASAAAYAKAGYQTRTRGAVWRLHR